MRLRYYDDVVEAKSTTIHKIVWAPLGGKYRGLGTLYTTVRPFGRLGPGKEVSSGNVLEKPYTNREKPHDRQELKITIYCNTTSGSQLIMQKELAWNKHGVFRQVNTKKQ